MKQIDNAGDALAYMVDCTLATVDDMALRARPPVHEYARQRLIAQTGVDAMQRFGVPTKGTRADDVVAEHGGCVDRYAQAIRDRR